MQAYFTVPMTYFLEEGRNNLPECLKIAFAAAKEHKIAKVIIFTARGEGIRMALENYRGLEDYKGIQVIAVTFPQGKRFTKNNEPIQVEIDKASEELFRDAGVPIVRAHLPFDPINAFFSEPGALGQDLSLVGNALSMFGGGMSLCVQAIVLACDAGFVALGEHVIAMTSDTAILAQATSTRRMLRELVIREILCKPAILSIGRNEKAEQFLKAPQTERVEELTSKDRKQLPRSTKGKRQ